VDKRVLLDWYSGTPPYSVSIVQGFKEAAKGANVLFADGSDLAEAQTLARNADVAIVVVGNHPTCNADGTSVLCPRMAKKTLTARHRPGAGRASEADLRRQPAYRRGAPLQLSIRDRLERAEPAAIVHMTHNSEEEGHGLADVLFGDYSPAGRLNQTWPTGDAQLPP